MDLGWDGSLGETKSSVKEELREPHPTVGMELLQLPWEPRAGGEGLGVVGEGSHSLGSDSPSSLCV